MSICICVMSCMFINHLFLYMIFLLLSPVWYGVCLFVCLFVYFVSGVIYVLVLYV